MALSGTKLHDQIAACGEIRRSSNNEYRYRCGQPACVWCRRRFVQHSASSLATDFGGAAAADLCWFSIAAPSLSETGEVFGTYRRLRQSVRNVARDSRYATLRAFGTMTPNPLPARLVDDADPTMPDDHPVWHPVLYGVAQMPSGVARQDFARTLTESSRSGLIVQTGPFDCSVSVAEQIAAHVRRPSLMYAATPCSTAPQGAFQWPLDWVAAYFLGLHNVGGGFRTTSFQRGLRASEVFTIARAPLTETQPLPILVEHQSWMAEWW